ncbi:precorrin-2 dehydrogenase/sirohydrochlorin ferrochelatase [Salsuginibacillus halophilus]|uniref:precorrin-2 dehydrogenase n=1 Tax=Salsuginibacillus halophilus TaxID=517424 RepID=A0A2P8H852_9BACI|nr:NAD(P)-dependent oxidoreductase [Salsuginibacillus halophilus]PSL42406.1 precorrin-2 dehydrogenase/sirohydrochlorin ferrochelatase [Salsuginibacillus halophilus]
MWYPIHVKLTKKSVLVVGGGPTAERKIMRLRQAGAAITVVSPMLTPALEQLCSAGELSSIQRHYQSGDGTGYELVFIAVNDPNTRQHIHEDCPETTWVNIADDGGAGDFITPGMFQRGRLLMTVSTDGASPKLAQKIINSWEKQYPSMYEDYVEFLRESRAFLKKYVAPDKQSELLAWLLEEEVEARVLSGDRQGADQAFQEQLAKYRR